MALSYTIEQAARQSGISAHTLRYYERIGLLAPVGRAAETGATPNQLVLAWLLHQTSPAVVPLIGPRTLDQCHAALPALEVKLDEDQLRRLDHADA